MVKFIISPGNGGCGRDIKSANWYNWFHEQLVQRGHESLCVNWPDPYKCHQSKWIPFCLDELDADDSTVVVGHSTGALLAMRLSEHFAIEKKQKLAGIILVAAAHTDLGDEGERASGYFDDDWNFEAQKNGAGFIHQFHSKDDHLIPVKEARFVAEQLQGDNHVYEELSGYSHFFEPFQQLLDVVDKHYPPPSLQVTEGVEKEKEKEEKEKEEQ